MRMIEQLWDKLASAPPESIDPALLARLLSYGKTTITPDEIADVLQRCVRYGQSSDFFVSILNMMLEDAVGGDINLTKAALDRAATKIEAQENA